MKFNPFYHLAVYVLLWCFSPDLYSATEECSSALKAVFSKDISKDMAKDFLKLQGDITLQRMTWAYLKAQKKDQSKKLESVENTIIELLNEKYSNSNPEFIRAREAYENFKEQPLSRTMLAEIAPYLKEILETSFEEKDQPFVLNASDLKLLSSLSSFEKRNALNGHYDHRLLSSRSPQGVLNFTKLINSSYKTSLNPSETDLNIELQITGLETVLGEMEKKLKDFLNHLEVPIQCKNTSNECAEENSMGELFSNNEDVQKLLWETLTDKLDTDDMVLEKLSYGDLWPRVRSSHFSTKSTITSPKIVTNSVKDSNPVPVNKSPELKYHRYSTPVMKPTEPKIIQEVGLIIEDPVGIILRDRAGRTREHWDLFDAKFKMTMAQAIILDDKIFEVDGKLFDRQTGKAISEADALMMFPPKRREEISNQLLASDQKIHTALLKAHVNGHKSFIVQGKLFSISGAQLNPQNIIAEEMGKKLGITISPDSYKNLGQYYLVQRANALKNNEPYFQLGNKTFDSYTGRDLSSPFGRSPANEIDEKLDKNRRRAYEYLSDSETIRNYNREKPNPLCEYYGVIDKKNAMFSIYSNDGKTIFSSEVLVGAQKSDQRTRWTQYSDTQRTSSASTGAGIFTIRPQDLNDPFNKKHFENNILSFKDENKENTVFAIHQVPTNLNFRYTKFSTNNPEDRRISGGCANLTKSDLLRVKQWLKPNCNVYVLPEESGNKFIVKDGHLKLTTTNKIAPETSRLYNFSSNKVYPQKIDIKITSKEADTQAAREFVKALEDEKAKLMSIYKLNNDEYNDLAMLAFGILGNESQFGKSKRLSIKENAQFAVITMRLLKTRNLDEATNTSRGLTQIKFLPDGPFKAHYPEVNKENLMNPRNSAVATMAYLAEASKQMRLIAMQNKSDPSKLRITKENMMDFMGYLYQGRRSSLISSDYSLQATPEFNGYYRGLQKNMSYIEMTQKIE